MNAYSESELFSKGWVIMLSLKIISISKYLNPQSVQQPPEQSILQSGCL